MNLLHSSTCGIVAAIGLLLGSAGVFADTPSKLLTDFSGPREASSWVSINDDVMGGISEGSYRVTEDETLVFSGKISLENRGGFASILSRPAELNIGNYDTIAVRVKGDGRTYDLNLRTSSRWPAASYRAPLPTKADTWQVVRVPIEDFRYTAFGRRVGNNSPDAAKIRSVGVTLADKQAGPFRLEVDWIKAEKSGGTAVANASGASKDIVEIAASAESFKTLVTAVTKAGLVDTLKRPFHPSPIR